MFLIDQTNSITNLNISVIVLFKILLVQHEFRAAVLHKDTAMVDIAYTPIMATSYLNNLAIFVFNINDDEIQPYRTSRNEIFFHIFMICNKDTIKKIANVERDIFPWDQILLWILFDLDYVGMQQLIKEFEQLYATTIHCRVLFLSFSGQVYSTNRNGNSEILGMSVWDSNAVKVFRNTLSSINLFGARLVIVFSFLQPQSNLVYMGNNLVFIGEDGLVTDVIVQHLNITAYIGAEVEHNEPNFRKYLGRKNENVFQQVITKNTVVNSVHYTDMYYDLYMSSSLIYSTDVIQNESSPDLLYPHSRGCLVVLVPRKNKINSIVENIRYNKSIHLILWIFLMFVVVRVVLGRSSYRNWFNDVYQSVGIYFAQQHVKINQGTRLWEKMWLGAFLAFTVFTVALLASIMYRVLVVQNGVQQIDTLAQLLKQNLTILYSDYQYIALKPWLEEKYSFLIKFIIFKYKILLFLFTVKL